MRIVELNSNFLGEGAPIGIAAAESPHKVGERTGDQKILLDEAQTLALCRVVVGIKHPSNRFSRERFGQRTDEIAAAEPLKIEIIRGGGSPQPQRVDGASAITHDWPIKRNANQTGRAAQDCTQGAAAHFKRAA